MRPICSSLCCLSNSVSVYTCLSDFLPATKTLPLCTHLRPCCFSVCLSVCLSLCLSLSLSVSLSVCLSVCLSPREGVIRPVHHEDDAAPPPGVSALVQSGVVPAPPRRPPAPAD